VLQVAKLSFDPFLRAFRFLRLVSRERKSRFRSVNTRASTSTQGLIRYGAPHYDVINWGNELIREMSSLESSSIVPFCLIATTARKWVGS
jgi:hypothetical protein